MYDVAEILKELKSKQLGDLERVLPVVNQNYVAIRPESTNRPPHAAMFEIIQYATCALENLKQAGFDANLVGSLARGEFEVGSDVNFLVVTKPDTDVVDAIGIVQQESTHCMFDIKTLGEHTLPHFRERD